MSLLIEKLTAQAPIGALSAEGARVIMALRLKIVCDKRGLDPIPPLTARMGGITGALRMILVTALVAALWPDPFALSPPCCRMLSHDEAMLGTLAEAAYTGDRARFDAESADMLNEEARDQLWRDLAALVPAAP